MTELSRQFCEPCLAGAPAVTDEERELLLASLNAWTIVEYSGVLQLEKVYGFNDYTSTITFANKLAELAESEDHHPLMVVEWGKVTVRWWTHKISGLHKNDFIMASKTDLLV